MSLSHDMLLLLKLFQSSTEPCVKQGDAADDAFKNAVFGWFDQGGMAGLLQEHLVFGD